MMIQEAETGDLLSGLSMRLGGEDSGIVVLIRDAQIQLDDKGRRILRVFDSIIPSRDTFIRIADYEIVIGSGSITKLSETSAGGYLKNSGMLKITADELISFNSDDFPVLRCSVVVAGVSAGIFQTELNSQTWQYPDEGLKLYNGQIRLNSHIFNFQSMLLKGSRLVLRDNGVSFFGLDAAMDVIVLNAGTLDIIERSALILPESAYTSDRLSLIAGEGTDFEIHFILEGCPAEGEKISADKAVVKIPAGFEVSNEDEFIIIPGIILGFSGTESGKSSLKASYNYKGWDFSFSSAGLTADGLVLQGKTDVRINSRNRRGATVPVFADRISISAEGDLSLDRSDALINQSYENIHRDSAMFADTVYLKPHNPALIRKDDEVLFNFKEYSIIQPAGYEEIALSGSNLIIDSNGDIHPSSQEVNEIYRPVKFYSPSGLELNADKWTINREGLFYSGYLLFDGRYQMESDDKGVYIEKAVFDQGALYTDIKTPAEPVRFSVEGWRFEADKFNLSNGRIHWYGASWIYKPENIAFPLMIPEKQYFPGETPSLIINYD